MNIFPCLNNGNDRGGLVDTFACFRPLFFWPIKDYYSKVTAKKFSRIKKGSILLQSRSIDLQSFNEFSLFFASEKKIGMNDFCKSSHEIIGILKITQGISGK